MLCQQGLCHIVVRVDHYIGIVIANTTLFYNQSAFDMLVLNTFLCCGTQLRLCATNRDKYITRHLYNIDWHQMVKKNIYYFLTPLLAIFQLYHGDQFQWWKKPEYPERTTDHGQATGKLYHLRLRVECTLFGISKAVREPTPSW